MYSETSFKSLVPYLVLQRLHFKIFRMSVNCFRNILAVEITERRNTARALSSENDYCFLQMVNQALIQILVLSARTESFTLASVTPRPFSLMFISRAEIQFNLVCFLENQVRGLQIVIHGDIINDFPMDHALDTINTT